jgi:hypothetical protein
MQLSCNRNKSWSRLILFDSDNKKCVDRMSNLFVAFYGTYEIEIPIFEIDIMKITKDFPYLNILIFTKRNESLEFHIPVFNDNDR